MEDQNSFERRFQLLENSNELKEFTKESAEELSFAPGDLFWCKSNGQLFRLLEAGDPLTVSWIQRYLKPHVKIVTTEVVSPVSQKEYSRALKRYLNGHNEKLRILNRDRLLSLFKPMIWDGTQDGSWLDLICVFHKELYRDENKILEFESRPLHFKRQALVATMTVIGAMALGYHKRDYLEDLYLLSFFNDLSLKPKETPVLFEYIDSERKSEEKFTATKSKLTLKELETYDSHPNEDYKLVNEKYQNFFRYSSVVKMLLWQHERPNGTGGPNGLNQEELSDIELWVSYCNRLIPLGSLEFNAYDAKGSLKGYFETFKKRKSQFFFMGRRVMALIEGCFENLAVEKERRGA